MLNKDSKIYGRQGSFRKDHPVQVEVQISKEADNQDISDQASLKSYRYLCLTNYKSMQEKQLLFVDMDGVLVNFYDGVKKYYPDFENYPEVRQREITAELSAKSGFFTALRPMPGAIEAFKKLSEKYNEYILSTPDWNGVNSWTEKRIWVEEHLGGAAYKKLILTHNKGLFTGRALIDDRLRNGVDNFKGEHIHFGTEKFPDWKAVLEYLLKGEI